MICVRCVDNVARSRNQHAHDLRAVLRVDACALSPVQPAPVLPLRHLCDALLPVYFGRGGHGAADGPNAES
jgi:hypothetical protein